MYRHLRLGLHPRQPGKVGGRLKLLVHIQALINNEPSEFHKVKYNSNVEIKSKQPVPLNPDHTHFLMVDDGYRYDYFGSGGIAEFIANVEAMIAKPKEKGGLGIPLITLLLEGGTDAIYEIKDNLRKGQPCVVVDVSYKYLEIKCQKKAI